MTSTIAQINRRPEIWIFVAIILLANATLLTGQICEPLIFQPDVVLGGEWWRTFTFPLVHVSWYHLLLDAGAFLFLYHGLQTGAPRKRLGYITGSAIGSLAASLLATSLDGGLCGLSGIAHGLMAITGLELMMHKESGLRMAGLASLIFVIVKSMHEALSGHVAFEFLHLDSIGSAVAVCHAGGVLGGLITFGVFRMRDQIKGK